MSGTTAATRPAHTKASSRRFWESRDEKLICLYPLGGRHWLQALDRAVGFSARHRSFEDQGQVIGGAAPEVDRGQPHELPADLSESVELGRERGIETVVLAPEVDDSILPLLHLSLLMSGDVHQDLEFASWPIQRPATPFKKHYAW